MIETVRLRNWKTHLDSSFEFGSGTNVLVGPMGSGKSSVMDAICFALFGTFPGLQSRRLSIEEVITNKPQKAEEAIVELGFSYAGKKYAIERKIKRKGSTEAKMSCGGIHLAGPKPRDVNNAVEKAIEINYNLFSRAVYSEQNEIDSFLRLTPRDRKAKFDELLDLQKYETVRANAVTSLNRLKSMARDKMAWVKEQKAGLDKEEEKTLLKRILEKERENEKLGKEAEKRAKEAESLEKEVKELEVREKEFRSMKEKLSQNKAVLKELEKALKETREKSHGKTLAEIEKEREGKLKQISELEEKIEASKKAEEEERKKKSEHGKALALNEKKFEELNKHLKELQGLGAQCPTCRQKLETKTKEVLEHETREEAKKFAAGMEKSLRQEAEASEKLRKGQEETETCLKQREKLKEEEMKTKHLREAIEKASEKEKQLETLAGETDGIEKRLKESDFDEKELLSKRKQAIEEKASAGSKKKEIEANRQVAKEMRQSLERIEKMKKQVEETEESAKAIETSGEKMNYFVNSLIATQLELREMLIATINQAMHDIWQRIYPYQDFVSAKMDVAEGSYELKAQERSGNWVRVEGILSGGERSAAAICIRIAFSLVLARNLSWLILDEPTHNLDSAAVETLGKMMQAHLPSIVEQIFVITHDNEMKKAASASLYVLEREKNSDSATRPVLAPVET